MNQRPSGHDPSSRENDPEVEAAAVTEPTESADAASEAAAGEMAATPHRRGDGGASDVAELEDSLDQIPEADAENEAGPAVTREAQLVSQIESLQSEADANRDKWLRAMAELENFRKRARRELESSINLARADLLKQLLEVLDNFERALDAFDQVENAPDETFVKGVRLIQDQFLKVLRDNEVTRIEAVGEAFDPNLHEAVSQIETDEVPSHHVARVIKSGYRLNDMVLRPAVVVVAQ